MESSQNPLLLSNVSSSIKSRLYDQEKIKADLKGEEINKVNQIENGVIDINSPEFKINDENIGLLDNQKIKESYKLDIGTIKF